MSSIDNSNIRVLVVDDVRDSADVYAALIARWGYETRAAYDGNSCLAQVPLFRPDVILLDVVLPDSSGYKVVESLRANPQNAEIKVYAVSGFSDPEHLERCRNAGFDDCFIKPVANQWLKSFLAELSESIRRK